MTLVERLQKECDRHTIGYPGPRREVAETLQLAATEIERLEKALETAREGAIKEAAAFHDAKAAAFHEHVGAAAHSTRERAELAAMFHEGSAAAIRTLSQKKED